MWYVRPVRDAMRTPVLTALIWLSACAIEPPPASEPPDPWAFATPQTIGLPFALAHPEETRRTLSYTAFRPFRQSLRSAATAGFPTRRIGAARVPDMAASESGSIAPRI